MVFSRDNERIHTRRQDCSLEMRDDGRLFDTADNLWPMLADCALQGILHSAGGLQGLPQHLHVHSYSIVCWDTKRIPSKFVLNILKISIMNFSRTQQRR